MPSPEPAAVLGALLAPILVFLCVVLAWRGMSLIRYPSRQDLFLLPWSLAIAVAWHPGALRALPGSQAWEPLFTLTPVARGGLIALVVVAALVAFALSVVKTRALRDARSHEPALAPAALDVAASAVLGLVALALAPQLCYAYYRRLLPELPVRWVAEGVPSVARLATLARPDAGNSLAEHAAALFVWTLVIASLLGWLLDVRLRRRPLRAAQAGTALAALAALWSFGTLALG